MLDGHTRKATIKDIKPGVILRDVQSDGSVAPFSDMLITAVETNKAGEVSYAVTRPYVFARAGGYASKFDAERFYIADARIERFHIVLNSKGEPYMMVY